MTIRDRHRARATDRRSGDGTVRFDVYDVADVDPTSDQVSTLVRSVEMPFGVDRSNRWEHIELDIDPTTFAAVDGDPIDAVLVTFRTPKALFLEYTFDNVRLMEWRGAPATKQPIWLPPTPSAPTATRPRP